MNIIIITVTFACFSIFSTTINAIEIPLSPLSKSCRSLVDKNLEITSPPVSGLSEKNYKKLTQAQKLYAEEKYQDGINILIKLEEQTKKLYIKAMANLNLAYMYVELEQHSQAYSAFNKAIAYGRTTFAHDRAQSLRVNVASYLYANDNKNKAVSILEEWLKNSNVDDASVYFLLAAMYADEDIGRLKDALCPAYYAVTTLENPSKKYFQLLLSVHHMLMDNQGSANVLEVMIKHYPQDGNFQRQLASLYLILGSFDRSLELMEAFYLKGHFESKEDYKLLASLYKNNNDLINQKRILNEGVSKGLLGATEVK